MAQFGDEFIDEISKVNPSSLVNDENANLPLDELQHNVQVLAKLLSVSSTSSPSLLSSIYGNLLDYNNKGVKIFFNGGNFDCFEKKNAWLAIDDGDVVNIRDIQSSGADDLLVYKGPTTTVDEDGTEHGRWLEREFFIPQYLRGSELIFAVKGTGVNTGFDQNISFIYEVPYCNTSEVPNISSAGEAPCLTVGPSGVETSGTSGICDPDLSSGCYARYEDIGIEVVGAVQVVKKLGPWPNHRWYAEHADWLPEYRTTSVLFKVNKNTDVIKIRIRRTRSDGAMAFSQMFLGGLPSAFKNYNIKNLDINELYNFQNGVTKWNVTTVDGRHVAQDTTTGKLPNLLTKEQFLFYSQFNQNIENLNWDDDSTAPRQTSLSFSTSTGAPSAAPRTTILEFDPEADRIAYYDMRVDGPNPGSCYLGVSYFVNENEFSGTISCPTSADETSICGYIKFDVSVGIINSGPQSVVSNITYRTFEYEVPIPAYTLKGKMGYFEIYGDFYQDLLDTRGSIAYFNISRKGTDTADTFEGNFLLAGMKTGITVPPDTYVAESITTYDDLFKGDGNDC